MKLENKRIFISDLPETVTPDQLENTINNYGNVTTVELKERKELGLKNNSLFFAYVNVNIDDGSLQKCFKDFASAKWFGQRVFLQLARESFLERLKRERAEATQKPEDTSKSNSQDYIEVEQVKTVSKEPTKQKVVKQKEVKPIKTVIESDESDSSSEDEKEISKTQKRANDINKNYSVPAKMEKQDSDEDEVSDLIIKSNKGKTIDSKGLKIESVGNSPIIKYEKTKKKPVINSSEANLKRLQSLSNLRKTHKTQKTAIQQALARVDNSSTNIVLDDSKDQNRQSDKKKNSLFDDYEDDEFQPNFGVKEQFQGEQGQKLLELQSRYKNDKRFVLDERFMDESEQKSANQESMDAEELSLEQEKKKEYEILEQVLGKKILPRSQQKEESKSQKKVMLRFDPTQPEHSKFELKNDTKKETKKNKRKKSEFDAASEKKQEEKEAPEVSKEIFYKVTDDLKDSLKEKQGFSLLSSFGKVDDEVSAKEVEETATKIVNKGKSFMEERNPFRYDSSDDEEEPEESPGENGAQPVEVPMEVNESRGNNRNFVWSEPFFFTDDDYRLQEGVDFVERMSTQEESNFTKVRRDLKEIMRAKVRNNQRKNRPFKKKLGGSRKKKVLRIKKALKR